MEQVLNPSGGAWRVAFIHSSQPAFARSIVGGWGLRAVNEAAARSEAARLLWAWRRSDWRPSRKSAATAARGAAAAAFLRASSAGFGPAQLGTMAGDITGAGSSGVVGGGRVLSLHEAVRPSDDWRPDVTADVRRWAVDEVASGVYGPAADGKAGRRPVRDGERGRLSRDWDWVSAVRTAAGAVRPDWAAVQLLTIAERAGAKAARTVGGGWHRVRDRRPDVDKGAGAAFMDMAAGGGLGWSRASDSVDSGAFVWMGGSGVVNEVSRQEAIGAALAAVCADYFADGATLADVHRRLLQERFGGPAAFGSRAVAGIVCDGGAWHCARVAYRAAFKELTRLPAGMKGRQSGAKLEVAAVGVTAEELQGAIQSRQVRASDGSADSIRPATWQAPISPAGRSNWGAGFVDGASVCVDDYAAVDGSALDDSPAAVPPVFDPAAVPARFRRTVRKGVVLASGVHWLDESAAVDTRAVLKEAQRRVFERVTAAARLDCFKVAAGLPVARAAGDNSDLGGRLVFKGHKARALRYALKRARFVCLCLAGVDGPAAAARSGFAASFLTKGGANEAFRQAGVSPAIIRAIKGNDGASLWRPAAKAALAAE